MDIKSLMPFGRSTGALFAGDPFQSMRRELDRVFEGFARDWPQGLATGTNGFLSPKVDISETDAGLQLVAELPGISEKDITLDLDHGVLTLKAEHRTEREEKDEKKTWHLIERSEGTYLRRFALPFEADPAKVTAAFDKGVLRVTVPKSPQVDKPATRIAIGSAA